MPSINFVFFFLFFFFSCLMLYFSFFFLFFLVRMKTRGGRAVINARRAKGRKRLAV